MVFYAAVAYFLKYVLQLDFVHFSPLGAWAICPAANEFYSWYENTP